MSAKPKPARRDDALSPLLASVQRVCVNDPGAAAAVAMLAEADKRAWTLLAVHGAMFNLGDGTDMAEAVEAIAKAVSGDELEAVECQLEAQVTGDAVTTVVRIHRDAAYYLGLAIGMRLGGAR